MSEIRFKVPTNRSALSVLGINPIGNGDVFAEDGYVYDQDNNRLRKWFIPLNAGFAQVRIWEPKLKNVALLEAKRWKYLPRAASIGEKFWPPLIEALREKKKVYGLRTPRNGKSQMGYIAYIPRGDHHDDEDTLYFSWASILHQKPGVDAPIDQETFDLYWRWEEAVRRANHRYAILDHAFIRAVENRLIEDKNFMSGKTHAVKTTINGRVYWWVLASEKYQSRVELFIAPESTKVMDLEFTQEPE